MLLNLSLIAILVISSTENELLLPTSYHLAWDLLRRYGLPRHIVGTSASVNL